MKRGHGDSGSKGQTAQGDGTKRNAVQASATSDTYTLTPESERDIPPPPISNESIDNISIIPPPYDFLHCATRIHHTGPYFLPDVLAAIRSTHGNFLEISALLGRRRTAVRDFIYSNPLAKEALDEVVESQLDQVEQIAYDLAINVQDPATVRFILSTKGKDRGYTPKVEHSGSDGKPLAFELILDQAVKKLDVLGQRRRDEDILDDLLQNGITTNTKEN